MRCCGREKSEDEGVGGWGMCVGVGVGVEWCVNLGQCPDSEHQRPCVSGCSVSAL